MIKEACVETFEQCMAAQQNGADRIELCSALDQDGLTPNIDLIEEVSNKIKIPVRVMIRNRAGDFIYSREEIEEMKKSIDLCRNYNIEGVVFGACTTENTLDIAVIEELAEYASPLKVTVHKAIDTTIDPTLEIEKLLPCDKITSVLTSGGGNTALDGKDVIKKMIEAVKGKIEIIVCGKVTSENLNTVDAIFQTGTYHGKKIVGAL